MRKHDITDAVREVLGSALDHVDVRAHRQTVEITLQDNFTLEFAHLEALAAALGTKHINIEESGYSPGYSENTPGSEGSVKIVVTMQEPVTG